MSKSAIDFPLDFAAEIAAKYANDLGEHCSCVEVVGSVRRRSPVVHDIEILVIPKHEFVRDMFGTPTSCESLLDRDIVRLASRWGAVLMTNGPKTKKLHLAEGIVLEICVSDEVRWPVEVVIKTGPADFSKKVVTQRRHGGYLPPWVCIKNGWKVYKTEGDIHITFEKEADFLELLGLGWVEPEDRHTGLRPK